jgi:hypothetical protein
LPHIGYLRSNIPELPGVPGTRAQRLLWHYTTWEGFEGIVRSGAIRASKVSCLNDAEELRHSVKVIVDEFAAQWVRSRGHDPSIHHVNGISATLLARARNNTCVTCFSQAYDQLSQWRAYSKGSVGIALGFERTRLERVVTKLEARLAPCVYSISKQRANVSSFVTRIVEVLKGVDAPGDKVREILAAMGDVMNDFIRIGSQLKDPGFREEREWRIVTPAISIGAANWGFRRAGTMVVPYVPIDLTDERVKLAPLQAVLIGPTPHPEETANAACDLLATQPVAAMQIHETSIPLRDW